MVIERSALGEQVVGADDRGVATGVAAANPAFFQYGDVTEAVFLSEVVRSTEPVTTTTDDDRIVRRLGLRSAPLLLPAALAGQPAAQEAAR